MTATNSLRILQHLRRWAGERGPALSDRELLRLYETGRDQSAFAELVRRHGAMVFAVCRSVLRRHDDAEDAFQAAFLVLARRAGAIRKPDALSSWLHGVAYRVALKARAERARRQMREADAAPRNVSESACDDLSWGELRTVLHAELAALPERFRAPLVLCYLEGLTQDEAAQRLGCTAATVKGRLQRGREKLRRRLERRGVALTAALAAVLTGQTLGAAVPEALVEATVQVAGQPSAAAALLAGDCLRPVVSSKMIVLTTALLSVGLVAAGVGMLTPGPGSDVPAATVAPKPAEERPGPRTDLYGDPLPDGALFRLGSVQLRHVLLSDFVVLPDGKTVLSAGGRVLRFWDLTTGRQLREVKLQDAPESVDRVTLSRDGKTLAAFSGKGVYFWEVATGKPVKTHNGASEKPVFLRFSPDGTILATGSSDGKVTFLEWEKGKERRIPLPERQIGVDSTYHGVFSPDGKWFVAGGGWADPLCVFDATSGREVYRLNCSASTSTVSPDSKRLAIATMKNDKGGQETVLRILDLANGKELTQYALGHNNSYFFLAFSPDGKNLACGCSERSCVVDCATGRVRKHLSYWTQNLAFSPDSATLIANLSHRLRLWDLATGKELHNRPGEFGPSMSVSPDGRLLAGADWLDEAVSLWDTSAGRLVRLLPLKGEKNHIRNLTFSVDGKTLTGSYLHGGMQFWDLATGEERRTVQLQDTTGTNRSRHDYFLSSHVSPDRKHVSTLERLYARGESTRLGYWDLATGKLVSQQTLPAGLLDPYSLSWAWSSDGTTVALPLKTGLALMQVETGKARISLPNTANVGAMAASPDDRLLATVRLPAAEKQTKGAKAEAAVVVWESTTGKEVATLPAGHVLHLALAPGNRYLVATDKQFLYVWDLATGKERRRWPLPEEAIDPGRNYVVFRLLLSPDGRRAFTALADGTALAWDLDPALRLGEPLVKNPSEGELVSWWNALASEDARRAYAAIWRLSESPSAGVAFLRHNLKPASEDEVNVLRRRIADLDHDDFATREKAFEQLKTSGAAAESVLRRALTKNPTLEARRRIQLLLERLSERPASGESLRFLRALAALEQSGAEGRRLLRELAAGTDDAWMTGQARAALARSSP